MTLTVGVAEAHNRLSELIDQAQSGTQVVISRRGVPVVELTPFQNGTGRADGATIAARSRQHIKLWGGRPDEELLADWRAERDSWE